jgi:ribonuclease P protein component
VNLTKHIALKNNSDDVDSEDYAQYFPSFFWIVRDFTLELVDSEGDSITSKDYLELALSDAKGFSDSVEQKNRIRRLLRTFFKERDCFTMIRPLLDEENLQNLNIMNLNSLRPEF